jgi:uncharacterized protein YjbJ (UPF0337 family)
MCQPVLIEATREKAADQALSAGLSESTHAALGVGRWSGSQSAHKVLTCSDTAITSLQQAYSLSVQIKENRMNRDIIEGNWKQVVGKVKEQWGKLTDDDLDVIEGKRDVLAGKIQERYGITRDEAEKRIKDWESGH